MTHVGNIRRIYLSENVNGQNYLRDFGVSEKTKLKFGAQCFEAVSPG